VENRTADRSKGGLLEYFFPRRLGSLEAVVILAENLQNPKKDAEVCRGAEDGSKDREQLSLG